MSQVREYRDYFEKEEYREAICRKYGVKAYRPNALVVIGRTNLEMPKEKEKQILSDIPGYLKILTYDDLFERMKRMAELYKI